MPSSPRIRTLLVGLPRQMGQEGAAHPMDRPWESGIFKNPVEGPIRLSRLGLEGDGVADTNAHGGPDKGVLAYAVAHYPAWSAELSLPGMPDGAFGENLAVEGLTEADACLGDIYRVGTARVQVAQPRQPCWKLARRWRVRELALLTQQTGRTGWYFRVLEEGTVQAGDPLLLEDRPYPEWSISRANRTLHTQPTDLAALAALAACPALASRLREQLTRRLEGGPSDPSKRLYGAQ